MTNVMANPMCKDIHERVNLEAYDTVVDLSCPHLPRDCQLEIIRMLIPTRIRLPLSFIQNQSKTQQNRKGFMLKLLPGARKVHR